MPYTWKDIFKGSKEHLTGEGRQRIIFIGKLTVSIVGGRPGLYGNFFDTFEVAILDTMRDFVTKEVLPEYKDDVIPYATTEEVVNILNKLE
jgi:hypothetical protein